MKTYAPIPWAVSAGAEMIRTRDIFPRKVQEIGVCQVDTATPLIAAVNRSWLRPDGVNVYMALSCRA